MRNQHTCLEQSTSREAWSARYEQLRTGWFAQEIGWGQALFMHQGMTAWMKAWSTATGSESKTRADGLASERTSQAVVIHGEQQHQLTRAWVTLILHRQQEVLA